MIFIAGWLITLLGQVPTVIKTIAGAASQKKKENKLKAQAKALRKQTEKAQAELARAEEKLKSAEDRLMWRKYQEKLRRDMIADRIARMVPPNPYEDEED